MKDFSLFIGRFRFGDDAKCARVVHWKAAVGGDTATLPQYTTDRGDTSGRRDAPAWFGDHGTTDGDAGGAEDADADAGFDPPAR